MVAILDKEPSTVYKDMREVLRHPIFRTVSEILIV